MKIKIPENLISEAKEYANKSRAYTSDRHDFHEGGLDAKERKMYEGKLGEKIFKQFLIQEKIKFKEDETSHTSADNYDFILYENGKEYTVDVKTRTKSFHVRTVELVKQMNSKPKDLYISVFLDRGLASGTIIGFVTKEVFKIKGKIENLGYLDNYTIRDNHLSSITDLVKRFDKI